jgi:hypothetical protein
MMLAGPMGLYPGGVVKVLGNGGRPRRHHAVREYLRELGRRGGKAAAGAGVKARYAAMTAEERSALARKAARARWNPKRSS